MNMNLLHDVRHFIDLYTSVSGEADVEVPMLLKKISEFQRKALLVPKHSDWVWKVDFKIQRLLG